MTKLREIEEVLDEGSRHIEETEGEARRDAAIAAIYGLVAHTALMVAEYIDNAETRRYLKEKKV
jgi:hypothetical protein